QDLWSSFLHLLLTSGARAFTLSLWAPPIFYLVGKYLSGSRSRLHYVFMCGLGAVPFVLLQTGMLWALMPPPYDEVSHKFVSRSFHYWLEMIRGGFADATFVYIAILVAAHAYEYLQRVR